MGIIEVKQDARSGRPLRGAVIGFGFIAGQGHVPGYLRRIKERGDVEIVAVADICDARRVKAQLALPDARIYGDYRALLEREGERLDFVDIATPPCDHARIANEALERGLHVLCEKPLATSLDDARGLLLHASSARRVIFPCHNYKHAPVIKAIGQVLQTGVIGRVRSVTLSTFRNTHAKGVSEWRPDWRRERRFSGGGIAMDHGAHTFYLSFDWLGTYPTAVTAKTSILEADRYDTEDDFTATLTFPNGTAHATLTWTAGVRKVIYTLHGDRGAITVDDDDIQVARIEGGNGSGTPVRWNVDRRSIRSDWMDASHVNWFNSLFDRFVAAIETEDFVGHDALEAYLSVQVITTAYRSAAARSLELPLATNLHAIAVGPQRDALLEGTRH
jgi:predicted dehydrogenase